MKRFFAAAGSALVLTLAAPLSAQDETAPSVAPSDAEVQQELDALSGMFGEMFGKADPLTPEQESRVPAAQSVVMKLFPEGTYGKMMDETLAPMMDGIMGNIVGTPAIALMELTGLPPSTLTDVDEAKLTEAVALLDPNAAERNAEIGRVTIEMVSGIMAKIEPSYRAGLARAYAVRFTQDELADLDAYFATRVGSKYAAESFLIFADPQVMSAMNEMMPAMMESMPTMMGDIGALAEKYPKGRTFSELSSEEQDQLAALLGTTHEELAASEPSAPNEPVTSDEPMSDAEAEARWVVEEGVS
ncbi:MAG: hypothetical protein AAF559_02765 [Pseudomonadota bacterium]